MNLSEKLEIANVSDVGKRRPHNEDSTLSDLGLGLVVLADGMGGYKAGEVASAIAVTSIYREIKEGLQQRGRRPAEARDDQLSPQARIIKTAITYTNSIIYDTAQRESECQGMGTTVMVVMFYNNAIAIGHVGDSRLYRKRNHLFQQLTRDHSLIQELVDRGMYTMEEACRNTPRNLVTRALGIDEQVKVDITEDAVLPGDIYLLCSDGLNDMVDDEEIHLTLSKYSANLVQAGEELVRLANAKGGKDNTSVILIRIREEFSASAGGLKKLISRFF